MPDPITTAATSAASAAAKTGKEVAKWADGYLGPLLKPTLQLVGQELKKYVKEKCDKWRTERREANLAYHLERTKEILQNESPNSPAHDSINTADNFEAWVDGAQDVDKSDELLSGIWERLLADIVTGRDVTKHLIEQLKKMTPRQAKSLLFFRSSTRKSKIGKRLFPNSERYPSDGEDAEHLHSLETLGFVERTYAQVIGCCCLFTLAVSCTALWSWYRFLWFNAAPSLNKPPNVEDRLTGQEAVGQFIANYWGTILVSASLLFCITLFVAWWKGFAMWKLTWSGRRVLDYARDAE